MRIFTYMIFLAIGLLTSACASRGGGRNDVVDVTYVHPYGVEVPPENWTSNGQVISTLKNGVVMNRNYKEGILEGETTYTYPHSDTIAKVETYSNGTLVKDIEKYPSGASAREIIHQDPSRKLLTTWYESGTPQGHEEHHDDMLIEGHYFDPSHQLESSVSNGEGVRTQRDGYGQLVSVDSIQNGQMVLQTASHPNGTPKEIASFQDKQMDGVRRTFFPSGEPNTHEEWSNGVQHGTTTVFRNGEKYAEVPYANGRKHGIERRYRDGNQLVEEITWAAGKMHGPYRTYIGNTIKTDWYYLDKQVSEAQFRLLTHPR
jgi:antitoxin component YwqK of YwqJK toxin-antitoxin module